MLVPLFAGGQDCAARFGADRDTTLRGITNGKFHLLAACSGAGGSKEGLRRTAEFFRIEADIHGRLCEARLAARRQ
jgi:hypothetical protein